MRDSGISVVTKQSFLNVQGCLLRQIAKGGKPVLVAIEHGAEIDEVTQTFLTKATDPRFRLRITDDGDGRSVRFLYRHPLSHKVVELRARSLLKRCFPGESLTSAAES